MNDQTQNDPFVQVAQRRSQKWLDIPRLSADLRSAAALSRETKASRREKQRICSDSLTEEWTLAGVREHATILASLRAMHRGKKHTGRRRVFGPDHPGGTAIVEGPIKIPADYLARYLVKKT